MGKAKADDQETAKRNLSVGRGTEGGTEGTDRQTKLGNLLTQVGPYGEVISRRGLIRTDLVSRSNRTLAVSAPE
jgi:hypothetical protein